MMRLRIPVFVKMMTPLMLIITLSIGLSGYRVYQASGRRWQAEMDRRLERVAVLVAAEVDTALLQQLEAPVDIESENYEALADFLNRVVTTSNVEWIGIYYQDEGHLFYWVDSDYTGVGYPFFYPTEEHLAALADEQVYRVKYTDEFGSYYGFIAPIVTEAGVIGIVEASLTAEASQLLEQDTLAQVLPVLVGGIFVALSFSLLITMWAFQRPMLQLRRGVQTLAAGRFGYTIPNLANDEIGDLAATFNQMSIELKRLYGELQAYNQELETRVKERTTELREERNRLNTILQNLADGLVVINPQGVIRRVNPAFANIVAQPQEALPGQTLRALLPQPEVTALVKAALAAPGEVYIQNFVLPGEAQHKPRTYKTVGCALVEYGDEGAAPTPEVQGAIVVLHDITHEAEVDQMKTDFISMVSHELRTPLTSVLGFAKLILKTFEKNIAPLVPADDQRNQRAAKRICENLDIIVSEAERLTRLINDVLDIAKIEAGKVEWHLEEVAIADILQQAANAVAALAEGKALTLRVTVEPRLPPVRVDQDRIGQVVTNLLSNALKFTDRGEIAIEAQKFIWHGDGSLVPDLGFAEKLRGLEAGEWVAVSVQDSGIGIAPENLDRVFEKFQQVGDMMTARPKGTGLGLTISKEIVEYHGGRIWAASAPGKGSTFTFALPLTGAPPATDGHVTHAVDTTASGPVGNLILVVDDEDNIRRLLQQELTDAGYRVIEAADGVIALNIARREHPNLIIMDLMMPGISGFDAISALRADTTTANIPVMILSVYEDRKKGFRLGADAYLTKPINIPKVLTTIEALLLRAARGEGHKKLLVIDEDDSVIQTITHIFREKGFEVMAANNGMEGVSKALEERPQFIIVDALISKMNNYEILRTLKCTRETQSACIIVLTMNESTTEASEALEQGADFCGLPEELELLVENAKEVS